jgi:putative ABC transport system permease protein
VFRLAVKSVRQKPGRLILTAIAVALGVSLVAATFTFTGSLRNGFTKLFTDIYAGQDIIVEQDPNASVGGDQPFQEGDAIFTADDVAAVQAVDGVERAVGSVQVPATIMPKDPDAAPTFGGGPTQLFNWSGDPQLDRSTIVDGHGPEADDQIVMDIDSLTRLGYAIGDAVRVAASDGVHEFTLVGTVRFGDDNNLQGATLAYITDAAAHTLTGEPGFQGISIVTKDGADNEEVAAAITKVLPEGTHAVTGQQKADDLMSQFDTIFNYINIFAIVFALVALFVGAYIIVNTFRIIVTQRTREFGLLRAIGATGSQVRTTILLEAVIVGIVATTVGIGIGYLFALGATALVKLLGADIFGAVGLPVAGVLWSYVLGMLVTIGAAIAPAIHASRISPMEALREAATDSRKPLGRRNIVGGAMLLLGAVAVATGLYASLDRPYIYVGVGAVLLILGATLLAAQVLVPLAFGLRGVLTAWMGVDGKLAANNIHREPRRSSNTAAALMIGVMLLALTATFTESLKSLVTSEFSQIKAEFFMVDSQGFVSPDAVKLVEDTPGVDFVAPLGLGYVKYEGETYSVGITDPDLAVQVFDYDTTPEFTAVKGGVFIDSTIQALGVKVGDHVELTGEAGTQDLEVKGLYNADGDANFFVDWDTGESLVGDVDIAQAQVKLDDGTDVDEMQTTLTDALSENFPTVILQRPDQLAQLASTAIDFILATISALLMVALLIALLGVANTLLLSVTERTREIGLLRAVGVKRSSVWRMVTIESMVMAIFGTILGMILGVGLGSALVLSLKDQGFDRVAIPWVWLAVYTVLAAIAGVLAAIWPAWRASRLDILQAIAADG